LRLLAAPNSYRVIGAEAIRKNSFQRDIKKILIARADKGFGGNLVIPLSEDLFGFAARANRSWTSRPGGQSARAD